MQIAIGVAMLGMIRMTQGRISQRWVSLSATAHLKPFEPCQGV